MAQLVTVYWRDIPAQVIAESGRGRRRRRASVELPERFAKAIDAAAMRGNLAGTDAYLGEWRRSEPVECDEDLEVAAKAVAAELDKDHDNGRLAELVREAGKAIT